MQTPQGRDWAGEEEPWDLGKVTWGEERDGDHWTLGRRGAGSEWGLESIAVENRCGG